MVTINTTQDLIHALETNREFREAARCLPLSQELLDMPDKLARLTATVEDFIVEQKQFNLRLDAHFEREDTAIGDLLGNVARQVVGMQFRELARDMGCQYRRILSRDEFVDLFPIPA